MKQYQIGEFEEIVLLAVGILNGKAYGVAIKEEIKKRIDREVSIGALQVTLRRLEKKGFLESSHGESGQARGGRPKLFFEITMEGRNALVYTKECRNSLWSFIPQVFYKIFSLSYERTFST